MQLEIQIFNEENIARKEMLERMMAKVESMMEQIQSKFDNVEEPSSDVSPKKKKN